jgi:alpha-N-arabinofuranosidase
MNRKSRRDFLKTAGLCGAGIAASSVLALPGFAQSAGRTTRATLGLVAPRADFNRRLFGAFLEHLGRAVYTGVYEPGSPLADKRGFRTDTLREVKNLSVPIMRYPGGNIVSGYNWWDGVGPKKNRPTVLERAWNQLETNQFGTNDFMDWAKAVGTEPLLGFNLGTGTSEMAVAYIEYCNYAKGTKWSELRRSHGYDQPHKVK